MNRRVNAAMREAAPGAIAEAKLAALAEAGLVAELATLPDGRGAEVPVVRVKDAIANWLLRHETDTPEAEGRAPPH